MDRRADGPAWPGFGAGRGGAKIAGMGDWHSSEGRIAIQNENLVLWVDGEPVIMVPDLIINLDLETDEPITTEVLRYGQRVAVVGPAAFGYPMSGAVATKAVVVGTLSLCAKIGETLRAGRAGHPDPVKALTDLLGAKTLFHGRIMDIERRAGYDR